VSGYAPAAWDPEVWEHQIAPGLPLNSFSPGYENVRQVFSGQGRLYKWIAYSSKGSSQFILVFDSLVAPGSGAVPTLPAYPIATVATASDTWGSVGRWFQRGCWLANSSTANSLTAGSADTWFDAQYAPALQLGLTLGADTITG